MSSSRPWRRFNKRHESRTVRSGYRTLSRSFGPDFAFGTANDVALQFGVDAYRSSRTFTGSERHAEHNSLRPCPPARIVVAVATRKWTPKWTPEMENHVEHG